MSAYNARFRPKEFFGIPLGAGIAFSLSLAMGVFALLVSFFVLKVLTAFVSALSFVAALYFLVMGDKVVFVPVMFESFIDRSARSLVEDDE